MSSLNDWRRSLVSTIYGTDLLDPGSILLIYAICCSNIPRTPSTMNAKSPVRCWGHLLSSILDKSRYPTHHLCQEMPKSVCLQCRRIHQRIICGNVPSTPALKVQDNTKDLETDADEVGSWVLALKHKVVVRQSTCDAPDNGGT
jgi:hypothetical protein